MTNKNIFNLSLKEKHRCYQQQELRDSIIVKKSLTLMPFWGFIWKARLYQVKDIWV